MGTGGGNLEGMENIEADFAARFMSYSVTQGMRMPKAKTKAERDDETAKSAYIQNNIKTTKSLQSFVSKTNGSHANQVTTKLGGGKVGGADGYDIVTGGTKSAS